MKSNEGLSVMFDSLWHHALQWTRLLSPWNYKRDRVERDVAGGIGMGIHVNPWLIHVNVWQNPLQYCKVISLQLIKINNNKKGIMEWEAISFSRGPSLLRNRIQVSHIAGKFFTVWATRGALWIFIYEAKISYSFLWFDITKL